MNYDSGDNIYLMIKKLHPNIGYCGIILLLIIVFFGKNLFNSNGTFIGGIDIAGFLYWNESFVKEMFLSGNLPLWNPYYFSGHPFLANPAAFIFYPATLLYVFLPLSRAFNLDILFHLFIAAIGMYLFVQLITQSKYAGLASAIVFSLNGYFMGRIYLGHVTLIHAAALIPLIFYYIEKALSTWQIKYFFISGIILGLQILGGDPHISYLTSLFLTLYFFIRWISESMPLRLNNGFKALRYFIFIPLIPLIAFGISAIQTLPTAEFRALSTRTANTYEYATFMSFLPLYFYHFLVPIVNNLHYFGEYGCYIGILSIILAGIGMAFSRHRKYSLCFLIMLLVALTFILGNATPIYQIYYKYLPAFSSFRTPARCLIIIDFLLSILVGFGLQHICEFGLKRSQYWSVIAILVMISCCLFFGITVLHIPLNYKPMILAIIMTAVSFVLLNLIKITHNKHVIVGLFVAVLFLDLYLFGSPLIPRLDPMSLLQMNDFENVFKKAPGFYRVNIPGYGNSNAPLYRLPDRGMKFHYYGINGLTQMVLKDYFNLIYEMANIPKPELIIITSFNSELFRPDVAFSSRILGVKYAIVQAQSGFEMIAVREYQPRAILIRNAIFTSQIEDHLGFLKRPDFNPRKTVLLENSARNYVMSGNMDAGFPELDTVTIWLYSPNRLELKSYSSSSTILLLSELYYPGWKAYVDGKNVPILRADYLLRAVKLDAGQHSITIVYRPMSFYIGSIITIFTILSLIFIYIFLRKKNHITKV